LPGNEEALVELILASITVVLGVANGTNPTIQKATSMTARGTFEVKVTPQAPDDAAGGPFERLFLAKEFHGDLQATSKGQMLAARTVDQSGGYVALEIVTGLVHGKRGSFVLQHKGTMRGGVYVLDIAVVPDSGTDELTGLTGTMTIHIDGRDHSYDFAYRLEKE
jgi:hypothetical protein